MALSIPNIAEISKAEPRIGEALKKTQNYVTQNTTEAAGNAIPVPSFVNPGKLTK